MPVGSSSRRSRDRELDTCTAESLELEPYVGTNNAARDLDALREALGDEQLSYVGFSYGTRLGATYAELFPDRVRALVLDGAVKPTDDLALLGLEQGPGFDAALESFAAACDGDADCVLAEVGPDPRCRHGPGRRDRRPRQSADRRRQPDAHAGRAAARRDRSAVQHAAVAGPRRRTARSPRPSRTGRCCRCSPTLTSVASPMAPTTTASWPGSRSTAPTTRRPPSDEVRRQAELAADSLGVLRRLPACQHRLHRSARRHRSARHRARRRCRPDPRDRHHRRSGDAVRMVGRDGRAAVVGRALHRRGRGHTAFSSVPCVDDVVDRLPRRPRTARRGLGVCRRRADDVFAPAGEGEFDQVIAFFDCLRYERARPARHHRRRSARRPQRRDCCSTCSTRPTRRSARRRSPARTSSRTSDVGRSAAPTGSHTDSGGCPQLCAANPQRRARNSQAIGTDAPQGASFKMAAWSLEPFPRRVSACCASASTAPILQQADRRELERAGWRTTLEFRENNVRGRDGRLSQVEEIWHAEAERNPGPARAHGADFVHATAESVDEVWSKTASSRPNSPTSGAPIRPLCRQVESFSTRRLTHP